MRYVETRQSFQPKIPELEGWRAIAQNARSGSSLGNSESSITPFDLSFSILQSCYFVLAGWDTLAHHNDKTLFSIAFTVEETSPLTITAPALAPDPGVNKVFLQKAIGSILRKRSYAAATDSCFRFLDQLQKRCTDTNSTLTKRDCFVNCGKLECCLVNALD